MSKFRWLLLIVMLVVLFGPLTVWSQSGAAASVAADHDSPQHDPARR